MNAVLGYYCEQSAAHTPKNERENCQQSFDSDNEMASNDDDNCDGTNYG